ncbi:MAG: FAD-linked oxidase [Promethearchaeota archaeon]|nr:MAG: FAD-linked oxidase [Candidatus Lokiarchaeota archaeon]
MDEIEFRDVNRELKKIGMEDIEALKSKVKGTLLYREIEGYDESRMIWNGMIDNFPSLILECENVDDVIKGFNFARENQIKISIRSGGHNVAGNAIKEKALVMVLSEINSLRVDKEKRIAQVDAGATLGDIDKETQKYGLATPLGLVSDTGVAGLAIRGGIGHLMRQFGLTCDNILSIDLITYEGNLIKVKKNNFPDIFWALRGGSIDIGVIVSFTFKLYPIGPEVLFYFQFFPIEQAKKALSFLRDYIKEAPRELGLLAFYATLPDEDRVPEIIRDKDLFVLYGIYTGSEENHQMILDSFKKVDEPLIDLGGIVTYKEAQKALDEDYPEGMRYYWKSLYLEELSDEIIEVIHNLGTNRPSPLSTLDICFMGGKIQDVNTAATAFNRRDANYMLGFESN